MKKTISILTILALISVSGCNSTTRTIESKSDAAKSEVTNVEMRSTKTASSADGKVVHPVSNSIADFEKQVANGIAILDFFAVWCPPCKRFSPIFINVSNKTVHADKLFIKIDIEQFVSLTEKYSVRSMPTIIALKDGKEVKRSMGAMSEAQFEKWLSDIK